MPPLKSALTAAAVWAAHPAFAASEPIMEGVLARTAHAVPHARGRRPGRATASAHPFGIRADAARASFAAIAASTPARFAALEVTPDEADARVVEPATLAMLGAAMLGALGINMRRSRPR